MYTHLSLCTGIGGLDIAAEWAGFVTVGQCELADYPYRVLCKNWSKVPKWRDIRDVTAKSLAREQITEVTILSAGFPCQPHSVAGERRGSCDERDLWSQVIRIIREVKPVWFLGENVPGLLSSENGLYFGRLLKDLDEAGYNVSWGCVSAYGAGAVHERERLCIVAYSTINRLYDVGRTRQRLCKVPQQIFKTEVQGNKAFTLLSNSKRILDTGSGGVLQSVNGFSAELDEIKAYGNAVSPPAFYPVFKSIMDYELSICAVKDKAE